MNSAHLLASYTRHLILKTSAPEACITADTTPPPFDCSTNESGAIEGDRDDKRGREVPIDALCTKNVATQHPGIKNISTAVRPVESPFSLGPSTRISSFGVSAASDFTSASVSDHVGYSPLLCAASQFHNSLEASSSSLVHQTPSDSSAVDQQDLNAEVNMLNGEASISAPVMGT